MNNFSPLAKILDENRLKGPNYSDWKRNLNIVLTAEKLVHVLNEEPPIMLEPGADDDAQEAYQLWFDHDSLAKCYILASLENRLQKQHEKMATAKDIMASLKEMFGQQNRSARQSAMKGLMSTKMTEGTPVHDHVMTMIGFINELESLGSEMDNETKIDAILSSLPDSFNQFVLNFNMNKMVVTLPELRNMLQRAEELIKKEKPVIMIAEKGKSSKPKYKNKKRNFGNNKGFKQIPGGNAKKVKRDKSEDACHFCGKKGHWKRNCYQYLASLKKPSEGFKQDGLYFLSPALNSIACIEKDFHENILSKRKRDEVAPTYLWHLRLGHINVERINRLVKDGPLDFLKIESYPTCEPCLQGKMTKLPFSGKGERALGVLDLIHSDVCGPINHVARGGFSYFITFTDDYSRYGYIYLMKHKSESFEKFKEFRNEVEKQKGRNIKCLRSDRGGEYLSDEFKNYLRDNGILSQLTPPRTPQHNGVSERRNRTLLDMVRTMMSAMDLPTSFWGYALETAIYLLNRVPTKSAPKTPYEMWTNKRPSVKHLKIWGCHAHVKKQSADKLESRTIKCNFVGYPKETIGYYFYNPNEQKVIISRNAFFLENEFADNCNMSNKITLEEIMEPNDEINSQKEIQDSIPILNESMVPTRKSNRIVRPPVRLTLLNENYSMISEECEKDPTTYKEAMLDIDKNKWIIAMQSEMDSMYSNEVWTLVDRPNGIKTIGCKWVFKRKRGPDGKVETYKARLVAKGYNQKEGIDYEETFSPVVMLKSIRILLAIAAYYDYEIWQMDVKTAFLNGHLQEDIYMDQPDGFISKRQEHKVCKLKKSIYGLKQASRSWNIRFDETIKQFGFSQNLDEACVYKKTQGNAITFLVLYVDDILLIGNDIGMLSTVKLWLSNHFSMKDLGDATYILGLKLYRDRSNRLLGLSQSAYINKIVAKFNMQDSKKGFVPFRHGIFLSKKMSPKSDIELERMKNCPYASAVGSLMYAMLCTRPDIAQAISVVSRYQSNPGEEHWTAVKHIFK
ncbi:hypothetical protein SLEP1_g10245 [Rubroshorea leprosula]|uniref:Retrovirus-related Pol polyprotein from transposon TNT 1-94 n=1 Tax=Rubroshorea leprosula TaxID=152421 RepID=A0AAV5IBZ7_9ROSI|nr:hypothetical protein SLEP1_g10245 [Rubroshorea leprosula]